MRKLACMALLFGCVYANARQISPGEAKNHAVDFLKSTELKSPSGSNALTPMRAPGVNADAASPYYVFNRGESDGFVIISGDDRAPKILGYSDRGSFDTSHLPPQLKAMMEQWAKQMSQLPAAAGQHPSWVRTQATRAGEEVLLETVNWGQGAPYNGNCPIVDGEKTPTGCTATAMAIVMKYHNWPATTQGVTYTNYNDRSQTIDYSTQSIDWMALDDPNNSQLFGKEASHLLELVGVAIDTSYEITESSAVTWKIGHRLTEHFKYSPECQFVVREQFDDSVWHDMLKQQLISKQPVIYCGDGGIWTVGHAYVIDGFSSDGLYHVNWGWDGSCNGYYTIDGFIPDDRDFSQNGAMTINIVPDKSGKKYSRVFMPNAEVYKDDIVRYNDWNFSTSEIKPNEPFTFDSPHLCAPWQFNGYLGLAIVDANDNIVQKLFEEDFDDWGQCQLSAITIEDGCQSPGVTFRCIDQRSPGLSEGQRYQIVCFDEEDPGWRIVTGGIVHPTYFEDKGLNSDYVDVNVNFDRSWPILPLNEVPENIKIMRGSQYAIYMLNGGGTLDVKARTYNKGGEDLYPDLMYFSDEMYDYIWITAYDDVYDLDINWTKLDNNRHDDGIDPSAIIACDGLIYKIEEDLAILIGYEGTDKVTLSIPETIISNGIEYKVSRIGRNALSNYESIKHISIGKGVNKVDKFGLANQKNLESLALNGIVEFDEYSATWSYGLKNIYLCSEDASQNYLNGICTRYHGYVLGGGYNADVNVFLNEINKGYIDVQRFKVYLPGQGRELEDDLIQEMWTYAIDRDHDCFMIRPQIDEIEILNVLVNGQEVMPEEDCIFKVPSIQDMEVTVNYLLHDRQDMTTVYDSAYNNSLPSQTITQSVDGIIIGNGRSAVYTLDGVLVSESSEEVLKTLSPGIYIIRCGAEMKKLVIR